MKTFRSLQLRVFTSNLESHQDFTMFPPPGKCFTPYQLKMAASNFIYALKDEFPGNEFRLVHKGTNKYNVIPTEVQAS